MRFISNLAWIQVYLYK